MTKLMDDTSQGESSHPMKKKKSTVQLCLKALVCRPGGKSVVEGRKEK